MKKPITVFMLIMLLLFLPIFSGCISSNDPYFKTFTFPDGLVNYSFEYSSKYKVKEHYTDRRYPGNEFQAVTLIGQFLDKVNPYTTIKIFISPPRDARPNKEEAIARAEYQASSFPDYKLLGKSELTVDNISALRIDFIERNLMPVKRVSKGPHDDVTLEVDFDTPGFTWMITMTSDLSTADADKPDFEHILQTFKILN